MGETRLCRGEPQLPCQLYYSVDLKTGDILSEPPAVIPWPGPVSPGPVGRPQAPSPPLPLGHRMTHHTQHSGGPPIQQTPASLNKNHPELQLHMHSERGQNTPLSVSKPATRLQRQEARDAGHGPNCWCPFPESSSDNKGKTCDVKCSVIRTPAEQEGSGAGAMGDPRSSGRSRPASPLLSLAPRGSTAQRLSGQDHG